MVIDRKSTSLEKIVGALKVHKPDLTVKLLKAKINVLRTNFNREFRAIEGKKVWKEDFDQKIEELIAPPHLC